MGRVLRTGAIVLIATALLNATTGLCLCRGKGPVNPADQAQSHMCCHRSAPAVNAQGTVCCQIENASHTATFTDVVVAVQPVVSSTPVFVPDVRVQAPLVGAQAFTPSPPVRILRI